MTVTHDIPKLISISHRNITRIKGKEYAPTAFEIEKEILKIISTMTDKELLTWYYKGFSDELSGSTSSIDEGALLAYSLGAWHAELGDDSDIIDSLTEDQILEQIKNSKTNKDDKGTV